LTARFTLALAPNLCYPTAVSGAPDTYDVEVFVSLRVPDRVALTALRTLTTVMDYGEDLISLEREDYYTVRVDAKTEGKAVEYVKNMVGETTVFANPNKETAEVVPKTRPVSKGDMVAVLVYPKPGIVSESLKERLVRLGYDNVESVGRGVLWRLELRGDDKLGSAAAVAVTKSRTEGLLLNPHSEDFEIL
jgi:phosphoribosylformylglycinamidine (FGAM) synthase PurS component